MNNKGFSMMELLATLIIIGVAFLVVFNLFRGTFSLTESQMDEINDENIIKQYKNAKKHRKNLAFWHFDNCELIVMSLVKNKNRNFKRLIDCE